MRLLALLGGGALLWLMALIVYSVVMRYVFNAPLMGAHDTARMSLVVVVFFGLAYCGWTGGHVAVDLIGTFVPRRALRFSDAVVRAVSGVVLVAMAWFALRQGLDALEYGEATDLIEIPLFPFFMVVAFGAAVYAVVLFVQAWDALHGRFDGNDA